MFTFFRIFSLYLFIIYTIALPAQSGWPAAFTPHGPGGGGYMYSPAFSPHQPEEVFLVCDMGGVYRSRDGAASWAVQPYTQLVSSVKGKVQFTSDPDILYVCRRSRTNLDDPLWRGEIAKSTDGGDNWQVMADPTGSGVHRLEADPNSTQRLLLNEYNQLFFTSDGGNTWSAVFQPTDGQMWLGGVVWDGNHIYVGTNQGLLVSHNNGQSFAIESHAGLPAGAGIYQLSGAKSGNSLRLFCLTAVAADMYAWLEPLDFRRQLSGMFRMDYSGTAAWTDITTNIPDEVEINWVDLAKNNLETIWAGGANDSDMPFVFKSENGGLSWVNTWLAVDNQNVKTGWAGEYGAFSLLYAGAPLGFDVDDQNPSRVIFTNGYSQMTTDGGVTWVSNYVDTTTLNPAGAPTPLNRFYRSSGLDVTTAHHLIWLDDQQIFAANTDIGQTYSADGGDSWTFAHNLFYPWGNVSDNNWYRIVQHPVSHDLFGATSQINDIYLGYRIQDAQITGGGLVVKSADGGMSWDTLYDFGHPVVWIELDKNNPERMYASVVDPVAGGVYRTDNGGVSWTKLPAPPRTQGHPYNIISLNDGGLVVTFSARALEDAVTLTESSGVFYSADGGNTWQDRTAQAMRFYTKDIIADPHDPTQNTWYATVWGRFTTFEGPNNAGNGGLYKTTDRGLNWTRIFEHERAESITIHPTQPDVAYVTVENEGLFFSNQIQEVQPVFDRVTTFPFWRPKRVFFKPGSACEVWVTTMGGGLWRGAAGEPPLAGFSVQVNANMGVQFTSTSSGATSYFWDFGDGTTATVDNPSHIYPVAGDYTVRLITTNTCGSDTITQLVEIMCPQAFLFLSANTGEVCEGENFQLFATFGFASYNWVSPNFNHLSLFSTVTSTQPGTYHVVATDDNGCTYTSNSITVNELPPAIADFGVSTNNLTATFTNFSQNATDYFWTFGDFGLSSAVNPEYTYIAAGTYTVNLTAYGPCGPVTTQRTVTVECPPVTLDMVAAGNTLLCPGASVVLSVTPGLPNYAWYKDGIKITGANGLTYTATTAGIYSVGSGGSGICTIWSNAITVTAAPSPTPFFQSTVDGLTVSFTNFSQNATTYMWDFGDGSPVSTEADPVHIYATPGAYQVTLQATNPDCGTVSLVLPVPVECTALNIAIAADSATQVCDGQSVILATQSGGWDTYTWFQDGVPVSGAASGSYAATVSGVYHVFVTDGAGCGAYSNTITVEVYSLPIAQITSPTGSSICTGENTWMTGTGGIGYEWTLPGGGSYSEQVLYIADAGATNSGLYKLTITDGHGCTSTATFSLLVRPAPLVSIEPFGQYDIPFGQSVILSASYSFYTYQWMPGNGTSPWYTASNCGYYNVEVTDNFGCTGVATPTAVGIIPLVTFDNGVLSATPADTYQWMLNGQPVPDATAASFTPSVSGNYAVQTTCGGGIITVSPSIAIMISGTGFPANEENRLVLYPNPGAGIFDILGIPADADIQVFDVYGRLLEVQQTGGRVDISRYPAGVYWVRVDAGRWGKVVKE